MSIDEKLIEIVRSHEYGAWLQIKIKIWTMPSKTSFGILLHMEYKWQI